MSKVDKYANSRLKVGLLGGSFNPAHEGHLHISKVILKVLNLDNIWWLVSPQNPLKSKTEMMPFIQRFDSAINLIKNEKINITDIEKRFGTNYTIATINLLKRKFPKIDFVWIIGADNLVQFHKWHKWKNIFKAIPIIVYDRDPYTYKALNSKAAIYFRKNRVAYEDIKDLVKKKPPVWSFLRMRKHPISSTQIRKGNLKNRVTYGN